MAEYSQSHGESLKNEFSLTVEGCEKLCDENRIGFPGVNEVIDHLNQMRME